MVHCSRVSLTQPENAVRRSLQQAHPDSKDFWVKLVNIVERAKHKSVIWQAAFQARRRTQRDRPPIVARQVAVWQPHHLLRIERTVFRWYHGRVPENIVNKVCTGGPGIT